mgnify:CR=1 FL=1
MLLTGTKITDTASYNTNKETPMKRSLRDIDFMEEENDSDDDSGVEVPTWLRNRNY